MSYTYILTAAAEPCAVIRSDGAVVPPDPGNVDYAAYLAQKAGGYTPTPMPAPTLAQVQASQTAALSTSCQTAIAAGFASSALGTANTYTLSTNDQLNVQAAQAAAAFAMANAKSWAAGAAAAVNEVVLVGSAYYLCLTAGTTGAAAPAWPTAFQQEVTDGTAVWALAGWLLGTTAGSQWHTPAQVIAVWQAYLAFVNGCRATYAGLAAEVNAATTVAAVQAVAWP